MNNNDRMQFASFLAGIADVYEKVLSEAAVAVYWEVLKSYPLTAIKTAFKAHLEDPDRGRFMPKPGEIVGKMKARRDPLLAWQEVVHAMAFIGSYRSVTFQDQVTNAVVADMGGWPWLCVQDLDEPWTQKEFERLYNCYQRDGICRAEPLAGLHERENRTRGYLDEIKAPLQVGVGERKLLN